MPLATINNIEKLNQEIAFYFRQSSFENFPIEISKNITYEEFLTSKILIIIAIRAGIPYSLFDLIQDYTPFTDQDWAKFLDISTKSLHRYKMTSSYLFKSIHSEKIIEVAEVTKIGLDVFGNMDKFKLWLNTPNFALGRLKPIDLLKDSYGKELVISELISINHGILV
jgi:putative toxin-antitoxin system antitoxin component (TIGR02293 family)